MTNSQYNAKKEDIENKFKKAYNLLKDFDIEFAKFEEYVNDFLKEAKELIEAKKNQNYLRTNKIYFYEQKNISKNKRTYGVGRFT